MLRSKRLLHHGSRCGPVVCIALAGIIVPHLLEARPRPEPIADCSLSGQAPRVCQQNAGRAAEARQPTPRSLVQPGRLAQKTEAAGKKSEKPLGPLTPPKALKPAGASKGSKPKTKLDLKTFRGDSFGAYKHALANKKYTIILFDTEPCNFCKKLIKSLESEVLAKYADRVVVSITDSKSDKGARELEVALSVARYPTMVILKTSKDTIQVAGRVVGGVSPSDLDRVIGSATKEPIAE
jgi:thiol-disulfide isomerase/thioredoxin